MSHLGRRVEVGFFVIAVIIAVLSVAACVGEDTSEAMFGKSGTNDGKTLRTIALNRLIDGYNKSVRLKVVEGKTPNGDEERRAILTGGGYDEQFLGTLRPALNGAPVEVLFFQTGDDRFAVVWVDDTVGGKLESVTLGRPEILATDDRMRVLRVGAVDNRVAVLPFFSDEIDLWDQINLLLIDERGIGFSWEQEFDPPVDVRSQVKHVTTLP